MQFESVKFYKTIELSPLENGFIFTNGLAALKFADNGELRGVTFGKKDFILTAPELSFTFGGNYKSSIDLKNPNKNWAGLRPDGMKTDSPESEFLSRRLVRTHNAVELRVKVRLNGANTCFEAEKIYVLTAEKAEFSRRIELTNLGNTINLRSYRAAFPSSESFTASPSITSNRYLTDGTDFVAAWFDPRTDACSLDGSFNFTASVENTLETGDSVSGNSVNFALVVKENPASVLTEYDAMEYVRDRLEAAGLRAHNSCGTLLKSLTCYEVEIGPLRLSETKCHHRYDHPAELAADLTRIKSLGFNTIEMMPSFLFPCYTVYDLANPDIQHGAGESIRPIIERTHELGMRVILDILLHGCIDTEIADWDREHYISRRYYWPEWQKKIPELVGEDRAHVNPLRETHPDWFIYEKPGEIFRGYTWTFDHANAGFQAYFADAMEKSITDWDVDGFRFDAPTWQSGVNSAENLPYSGADSVNFGHCEMFRKMRDRLEKVRSDVIFIVEGPYYQYSDTCDMAYSYDIYSAMRSTFSGKSTARNIQKLMLEKQCSYPRGSLWLNFADNHDTWNNGVTEDGLYSFERFGVPFAKAMFAVSCFADGALQAFGGSEFGNGERVSSTETADFADFVKHCLAKRSELSDFITDSDVDFTNFSQDERILRIVRRKNGELVFSANLSFDTVSDFKPCEVRLTLNGKQLQF